MNSVTAYRCEDYSLLDILNDRVVAKKHDADFPPPTDLLVAVENPVGERVVLSWGEIYYPAAQHRVLIAARAAPAPALAAKRSFPAVFYGRGKGYHGFQQFSGVLLREALQGFVALDPVRIRRGYVVAASIDGYRIAMSFGELFGRNDQAEFLLVDRGEGTDGGRFSIFPAADFFSDRALKAVSDIYIMNY